jgi:hypothetical protein
VARRAALFGDTVHVTLDNPEREWPKVESELEKNNITVLEAAPAEPSLEDVFIELVSADG